MSENHSEASPPDLPTVFARLADSLDPRHDVSDTMNLLVDAVVRFTTAVGAGIVLADHEGVLHVMASTSERAAAVEETELGTEQGPCFDSYRSGQSLETRDFDAVRDRWPTFVRVAEDRGFRSAYAVPLAIRGQNLGAINIFFDRVGAMTDGDAAVAQALAQFATIGIVQRRTAQQHANRAEQLQFALDSRVLIEQAKGAISHQRDISVDEAFVVLRDHARRNGARLGDIAQQVVSRRLTV